MSSALSRALASTAVLFSGPSSDPGQQLARDIILALSARDIQTTPTDEATLTSEMELLARGALVLMEFADELQQKASPPADVYMVYLKTMVVFNNAIRKARTFWDMRGQRITRRIHEIIKTLNAKYQECLSKAEMMQKLAQQQSTNPMTVSTSTMMRSTNKFYELLVGQAKQLALGGYIDEIKNDPATVRKYTNAILLLEMVLLPDDQRPLTIHQREYAQLLLKQMCDRLQKTQLQPSTTQAASAASSASPPRA